MANPDSNPGLFATLHLQEDAIRRMDEDRVLARAITHSVGRDGDVNREENGMVFMYLPSTQVEVLPGEFVGVTIMFHSENEIKTVPVPPNCTPNYVDMLKRQLTQEGYENVPTGCEETILVGARRRQSTEAAS